MRLAPEETPTGQPRPVPRAKPEAPQRGWDRQGGSATHLSLKSRKTLARVLPPAIMDTSMARRKLLCTLIRSWEGQSAREQVRWAGRATGS